MDLAQGRSGPQATVQHTLLGRAQARPARAALPAPSLRPGRTGEAHGAHERGAAEDAQAGAYDASCRAGRLRGRRQARSRAHRRVAEEQVSSVRRFRPLPLSRSCRYGDIGGSRFTVSSQGGGLWSRVHVRTGVARREFQVPPLTSVSADLRRVARFQVDRTLGRCQSTCARYR